MTNLQDLLHRIENGQGADREQDIELWLAFTPGATRKKSTIKSIRGLWSDYALDETREGYVLVAPPSYTTSIDAALALMKAVFPRDSYVLGYESGAYCFRLWFGQKMVVADHQDICRAILAACIKALIAQG